MVINIWFSLDLRVGALHLDIDLSLFTVHLGDDELGRSIRPLLIVEEDDDGMVNREALLNARLVVVCGDKLALVGSPSPDDWDTLVFFHLNGLGSPTEPPRWSPVPELEGALFISGGQGVSCKPVPTQPNPICYQTHSIPTHLSYKPINSHPNNSK